MKAEEQFAVSKHEDDLRRLQSFRLLDDDFMTVVFEDTACAELLLKIILQRDDLTVRESRTQYGVKNLQGRSVRLDIYAVDAEGKQYNVEVQRSDRGAGKRRARYNSSLLDANIAEPGADYEALPETYVIFITEHDVLRKGLPIYHIERVIRETGECFDEGTHILYVNNQIRDNSALGRLMHDFACTDAGEMHYPVLSERVRYFKEDQKGVSSMSRVIEEMRFEERRDVALRMLQKEKYSYDEIAEIAGLSLAEVKALDGQQPA